MSAHVEPMRLVLLAEEPEWGALLRARLELIGGTRALITAPSWEAASNLFDTGSSGLLLSTPACLPPPGQCPLPIVLLLDEEPAETPDNICDWLVRDQLSAELLRRCLRYASERARLAERDALTGIANRQGFDALLTRRLAEHQGRGLVLGHLDLDNFRHVNDTLGYQCGHQLILQVVARLKALLGVTDDLARLGSDEFALLIDTRRDPQRAEHLALRICDALSEPYRIGNESLLLGCSLGLAAARNGEGSDPLQWHAHLAMQQAKSVQGCTYHQYDEHSHRGARSLVDLESRLRRALRRDELELHYQPRLCLRSRKVVGLEALVRWQHPDRGLIGPDEFVPLAETSGLIVPLGYWVIARALRDMQWLRGRGLPALHMAINLSFRQFQDSQLQATLGRLIEERGADPRWLEFELTETSVMHRSEQVQQAMQALAQLGVRFSLDDFGTGFSSFAHLDNLPIALLKIDRSFVASMSERAESRRLVQAMINLAHNLQLEVVAEGVETAEQLALLRRFGCDQVQGFLISKALPLADLARFLVFSGRQTQLVGLPS